MADFGGSDLDAFRAEAREWLEANFPKSLRRTDAATAMIRGGEAPTGDAQALEAAHGREGLGRADLAEGIRRRRALRGRGPRAAAGDGARSAPTTRSVGMGTSMFGPTLLEYGTEEQKQRHIPPIVRGEMRWCQGYSEPGAGSDLASLQTKCEDKGDHWLINGQKIWTSGAQYADWCFCLVRTDTTKKHEGISFVLIDMHQPGVETRPIKLIAGNSPVLRDLLHRRRAEKDDMVGPLNGGWTVGKRLLQHERSGQGGGRMMGGGADVAELAKKYVGVDDKGRIADADLRTADRQAHDRRPGPRADARSGRRTRRRAT